MAKIEKIMLQSTTGFTVEVLNLGGIITKIMALDKYGSRSNVVLNYENLDDYHTNSLFLGCFVGPVAGRTKDGKLPIDGKIHQLDVSLHPNSLHSCKDGLHNVFWEIEDQTTDRLVLSCETKDDNCTINYKLTYTVSNDILNISNDASSTSKTYLTLTNHSYFNLSGNLEQTVKEHELKLNCSHFVRLDQESLPVELVPIKDSPVDFSIHQILGEAIESNAIDIRNASGIDHPFKCESQNPVAILKEATTGRIMKVSTTQPYVIVYSGNFLHSAISESGKILNRFSGICFETQDLPNVINNKLDKVVFVTPEAPYSHQTSFSFSTL